MKTSTITIDLAKNVFQVIGFNGQHKTTFNKRINRKQLITLLSQHTPCHIVMEACYSSHFWGRKGMEFGHTMQLIPAQHVTPFVRGNKNDNNDALAIYEASLRPNIKFVPIKTEAQQEILMLHKLRERLMHARVAATNQLRGLLADFGLIFPQGRLAFEKKLSGLIKDDGLRPMIFYVIQDVYNEFQSLQLRIQAIEKKLKKAVDQSPIARLMQTIPGIGYLNASVFAASIDKGQAFNNARDFGVWLGLTPKQHASGEKSKMSGITKRGNQYLRKQLINGARAIVARAAKKNDRLSQWINQLHARKHFNCTVVATAHKLARIMWAMLQSQTAYKQV